MNDSINSPHNNDRRVSQQKQQIVPCTVSVILNLKYSAVEGTFTCNNYNLHIIMLVGYIKSVQQSSTFLEYDIHDGTSDEGLHVRKWIEDKTQDYDKFSFCRENCFVRVVGNLRQANDTGPPTLVAFSIVPLENSNELSFHLIDVVQSHLHLMKLQINETFMKPAFVKPPKNQTFEGNELIGDAGLDDTAKQILAVLNQCTNSEGLHITEIAKKLPKYNEKLIREKLNFLHEEGHVYYTISEDHFYVTK
ncbi:Replication protein A 32 kDa subunit [Thelohanellus kitauei]|uniref:Replication protein A 32 kDa subunit n=1 Tax=Thelohanellus kitauei TaxID=669202 RepID=A0A0C2ISQ7_THEKT|nr:Replication protein A 32 kDa subunit [Thelohanellus kitauei]